MSRKTHAENVADMCELRAILNDESGERHAANAYRLVARCLRDHVTFQREAEETLLRMERSLKTKEDEEAEHNASKPKAP